MSTTIQNCTVESPVFCTVCTVSPVSVKQLKNHHSVDELKLRHLEELDEGVLELELHDHRDSITGALARLSPAQYLYTALGWR